MQIVVTRKRGNAVTCIRWQSMIRISFAIFLSEYRKTLSASAFYYYRLSFLLLIKVSIFIKYEHYAHYFILFITICHYLSQRITRITLHFYYIYSVDKNFLCKKSYLSPLYIQYICSNNYLMISILSALFDFAYCLLLMISYYID